MEAGDAPRGLDNTQVCPYEGREVMSSSVNLKGC